MHCKGQGNTTLSNSIYKPTGCSEIIHLIFSLNTKTSNTHTSMLLPGNRKDNIETPCVLQILRSPPVSQQVVGHPVATGQ